MSNTYSSQNMNQFSECCQESDEGIMIEENIDGQRFDIVNSTKVIENCGQINNNYNNIDENLNINNNLNTIDDNNIDNQKQKEFFFSDHQLQYSQKSKNINELKNGNSNEDKKDTISSFMRYANNINGSFQHNLIKNKKRNLIKFQIQHDQIDKNSNGCQRKFKNIQKNYSQNLYPQDFL
ncbi:hypothetical protein PPERSA_02297 [Pseudocohnilembus persalinus]|uniref:Uncharacterized protein n=1 Tax=Pseudocohnilembus persalinus TaxID=266149 RepID=A0A0V0QHP0_PSEPJ|nr:hypothetical protein PPERSA_02297 [Pseudocohnilembus persalinus]|eukprot:KRX01769.1 hypothetical protein PPERSA_02297 [Pseudocohnilembus persalinus]